MVFLGFLLGAAAIAVGAGVVLDNTDSARLAVFDQDVPGLNNEWQVFLAGAGVAVVLVLGLMLTCTGAARRIRNRRDLRDLREEHQESLTTLEMEKRRLERELARVRQGPGRRNAQPQPQPAPASPPVQGVRVAGGRSRIPATSPFFERGE
ncbi:hypothetical protein [Actinomadura sp. BRA 177]|uniref:hypothetical protein n=1 Tax=Actinomadura sp. BRA 177 TaxID=2745202 RepID=UPI0015955D3C|nr:hypothetical protein [Actinomadura sp. BRA 177]NVI86565.1 hypothetical protein [Actinomadura sp. BRA 177]